MIIDGGIFVLRSIETLSTFVPREKISVMDRIHKRGHETQLTNRRYLPSVSVSAGQLRFKKSLKCPLGLFYWMNVISWLSAQKRANCWLTIKGLFLPKLLKQKLNVCDFSNGVHSKMGMSPPWPGLCFSEVCLTTKWESREWRRKKAKGKQKDTYRVWLVWWHHSHDRL